MPSFLPTILLLMAKTIVLGAGVDADAKFSRHNNIAAFEPEVLVRRSNSLLLNGK